MVIMSLYYNPKMTSIEQKDYLLEKKKKKNEEMKRWRENQICMEWHSSGNERELRNILIYWSPTW